MTHGFGLGTHRYDHSLACVMHVIKTKKRQEIMKQFGYDPFGSISLKKNTTSKFNVR